MNEVTEVSVERFCIEIVAPTVTTEQAIGPQAGCGETAEGRGLPGPRIPADPPECM